VLLRRSLGLHPNSTISDAGLLEVLRNAIAKAATNTIVNAQRISGVAR
jgi:hypothetical protein